jgi:uncharacterized protein with HEPN domain
MYDKTLVIDILDQLCEAVAVIEERCGTIGSVDDFLDTKEGQERLDGICMKLIAVGESLKNIDAVTDHALLSQYPQIEWKKIKGIRDFISHHYFDLDAEVIFNICQNHTVPLLEVLRRIRSELAGS